MVPLSRVQGNHDEAGLVPGVAIVGPMASPAPDPSDDASLPNPYPPGHYYSPIPSAADVEEAMAARAKALPPGLVLDLDGQMELVRELSPIVQDHPYRDLQLPGLRYDPGNGFFGISDAVVLHGMLRWARPARVVEVGSGWSSACMLDTDEHHLDRRTRFTFIDPDPVRLDAVLTEADLAQPGRITVHRQPLQEIGDEELLGLAPRDVLFIDSSHVSKAGSDVNRLLLDIVPRLAVGVLVHVHDIAFPFEYHRDWLEVGWFWNEAYLLRALLTGNPGIRVRLFNNHLATYHRVAMHELLPGWTGDGLSLWLEIV